MKRIINILLFVIFIPLIVYSQAEDSTRIFKLELQTNYNQPNHLNEIQIKFDEFDLHRELNLLKTKIPINTDPQTVWLRTSIAVSGAEYLNQNFSPHFLSSLEKKYFEDSKFNLIRYILGAAQTGAAGYLAYKHIKKYGFIK